MPSCLLGHYWGLDLNLWPDMVTAVGVQSLFAKHHEFLSVMMPQNFIHLNAGKTVAFMIGWWPKWPEG